MGCNGSKAVEVTKPVQKQTAGATLLQDPVTESKPIQPTEAVGATFLQEPATESKRVQPTEAVAAAPTKSKFFAVYHTFKSADTAGAFWKFLTESTPEDMAKMNAYWQAMGFHNHLFLPEGGEKPACCIWETRREMTAAAFQAFIDSDKGPGGGTTLINRVTHAASGAVTPLSFFEEPIGAEEEPKPSTGAFFWVDHTFKSVDTASAFWKFVTGSKPEDTAKMKADWDAMGFHNHFFVPEGGAGQTICIWESKSDMTAAEFLAFMDSEKGPGGGQTFTNEVHKVAHAGLTPSAFFAAESPKLLEDQAAESLKLLKEQVGVAVPAVSVVTAEGGNASQRGWCLNYCSATEAQAEIVVQK